MQWVFLLFPFVELWTLIELGDAIGPFLAILWVFLGIVTGLAMIRRQGLSMIRQVQRDSETGLITPRFLADDLAVVTSGLLLMFPGLVTDGLALLVLIGPVRRRLSGILPAQSRSSVHVRMYTQRRPPGSQDPGAGPEQDNVTVEGDYRRLDD